MTRSEAEKYRAQIENSAVGADDNTALEQKWMYPAWETGKAYAVGDRLRYGEKLWKVLQAHTSQSTWTPDITPALYTEVSKPGEGTHDNPIVYNNNMELTEGLYYTQGGVLYICTRSTGVPVYNDLAELVGIYVEVTV